MDAMEEFEEKIAAEQRTFPLGPEHTRGDGIPVGSLMKRRLPDSKVYPDTSWDYWVYTPAQYDAASAAAVMIFLDGSVYLSAQPAYMIHDKVIDSAMTPLEAEVNPLLAVFDNLIHAGDIPVTIVIFIDPGSKKGERAMLEWFKSSDYDGKATRDFEYNKVDDVYPSFLTEELLVLIAEEYNLDTSPLMRGICGFSAGGIAAFNAAWWKPDCLGKVLSHCGSFSEHNGGDTYISAVAEEGGEMNLRVFIQSGANDGNYDDNRKMAEALMSATSRIKSSNVQAKFSDAEHCYHSTRMGLSILPESLRWLWRDWKQR